MRAVVITKHGGPEVLQVQERPDPPLGPGQVRIDVAARGINFADVMARMGLYPDAPKTPCVVGYEVAGTVLELGEGVDGLSPRAARVRRHAVRRLRLAGGRAGGRRGGAARRAQLRAGRGDPRQLRDRVGGPDRLRRPAAAASACSSTPPAAASASRRRRSPSASARRSTARPRRPSTSASASSASTARSTTRAPAGSVARRQFDVILDAVGGKSFRTSYDAAAPGRPAGRVRRLLGRLGRAQQPPSRR